MPSSTAARIGPIDGIWQKQFPSLVLLALRQQSRRTAAAGIAARRVADNKIPLAGALLVR